MTEITKAFLTVLVGAVMATANAQAPQLIEEQAQPTAPITASWEEQYAMPVMVWPTPTPPTYEPTDNGQCVSFAREYSGIEYYGDAITWKAHINSTVPEAGSVVVLRESKRWHLAVVLPEPSSRSFEVIEQNYLGLGIVSTRSLDPSYGAIEGYVRPTSRSF